MENHTPMKDTPMNDTPMKEHCEPLKQISLHLEALKHTILKSEFGSLHKIIPQESSLSSGLLEVSWPHEQLLQEKENHSKWFRDVTHIYNTLQATVNSLQVSLQGVCLTSQELNSPSTHFCLRHTLKDSILTENETQAINGNIQLKIEPYQKIDKENVSHVDIPDFVGILKPISFDDINIKGTVINNNDFLQTNAIYGPTNANCNEAKLLFEKAVLYHKEHTHLIQQCKYIEVKIKTTNKLLNHLNNEMSKKVQELTDSLSNISQQNTKLHFAAVFALNHMKQLQKRITGLNTKKMCLNKKLHEKEVYLAKIKSDVSQLYSCLNSFLEFEKLVQQDFKHKNASTSQESDRLAIVLTTKKDGLRQMESMIIDNNTSIIPPLKKEVIKWKNAYQEASKEIEDFNKTLYLLNKEKEQFKNEDIILKQDIDAVTTQIMMQKDVLRLKKEKYKKNKRELERKYKEVKSHLQKIIHAIVLDDMCYARLKMSDEEVSYKHELKLLLTGHNECRARKQYTTMKAEAIKDSMNIIYNEFLTLKDTFHNFRSLNASELMSMKIRHSTQEQGILFLLQKKDTLKDKISLLEKQIKTVLQSVEYSALMILMIQNQKHTLITKISSLREDKKRAMEMLGFRVPLVALHVEEKGTENCTEKVKSLNLMDSMEICTHQKQHVIFWDYYFQTFNVVCLSKNILYENKFIIPQLENTYKNVLRLIKI